jgi:signal transduction histidine kinase/DNA-binding LacI/PurR family transcriptional regulator/AraC-like DNA-binding protein
MLSELSTPSRPASSQPSTAATIGMLTAGLNGPTEIELWHGVADRARERGINLICFSGGIPQSHQQYEDQKNILFDIAGQSNVSALLVWANILSHTLDRSNLETFCRRYAPLPIISMGIVLPSIPSIQIDMRGGMRKLLTHLIEKHGRRKIAFIRGSEASQDAEERYTAYLETLAQHGLPVDSGLVIAGDFRRQAGIEAIRQLLDTHRRGFDALASANDNMAIGAMQALQAQGVRIPDDVMVVGFDDIEETRAVAPSLTTVRAPWHLLGSRSVDLVMSKLAGDPLPDQIQLETELVYRQSCGCQQIAIHESHTSWLAEAGNPTEPAARRALGAELDRLLHRFVDAAEPPSDRSAILIDRFLADAQSRDESASLFMPAWVETLSQVSSGSETIECQALLNAIRSKVDILLQSKDEIITAHRILENAYGFVGELAHRRQIYQLLEVVDQTSRLNRIVQTMSITYDIETLTKLLALELPGLGIHSCFLSLYDEKGDSPAWSRLMLAFLSDERLPLDRGGLRFPTRQLVPSGLLPNDRRFAFGVEALFFQEEQIGFVLFEIGPRDGDVYATLRGHLSSALKSAGLVQVALAAEAKAIKSDQLKTRLLANVSHELRAPLNIILGLSQAAAAFPNPYSVELPAALVKDLGYIYDSGEHLIRLINDLLDMSRAEIGELDLAYESVAPSSLLKDVFETFKQTSTGKRPDLAFTLAVPDQLPMLRADPVRLRQVVINLLSNAFKFTRAGKIVLGAEIQLPHLHFWVSDTGAGIPPNLQERIFEPFVTVGPPGQRREGIGLGLSITRRLVALHGGSITLDSLPDHGSTFHVYLPLPGIGQNSAQTINAAGAQPILLWLSSNRTPAPMIRDICQGNGFELGWLSGLDAFDRIIQRGTPVALAWDLDHSRPGDWSIVQRLRSHAPYCQLPLLLFQDHVAGQPAKGSRLTNILLKPAGQQALQHVVNLLPQALQRGEIWIVDDDPQALDYYQALISSCLPEFTVVPVRGGRDAIQLLEAATPDLVLLDLVMPDIDGFDVLERLRNDVRTALVPVIVITGKILSYADVKRLDAPKVILQTKGVLSDLETATEIERMLTSGSALPQPTSQLVKQASAYVQQNYARSFSLVELCEAIGVSKSYLSRIFKKDTGISLWDYLNRFRVQRAKELLLLTDASITEVAARVGYEDVGYFSRVFHEIAGCSPRAYRQQPQSTAAG